jgi:hypothetical protein
MAEPAEERAHIQGSYADGRGTSNRKDCCLRAHMALPLVSPEFCNIFGSLVQPVLIRREPDHFDRRKPLEKGFLISSHSSSVFHFIQNIPDIFRMISLQPQPPAPGKILYFINLSAYLPGQFTELHANAFAVAASDVEVKKRAKAELLRGAQSVHTDDLFEIMELDCLMARRTNRVAV